MPNLNVAINRRAAPTKYKVILGLRDGAITPRVIPPPQRRTEFNEIWQTRNSFSGNPAISPR